MSGEIKLDYAATGKTIYALIVNAAGNIWNGTAFETPTAANWATYAVTMAEKSTTAIYEGTFPSVAAGVYALSFRRQLTGSPLTTDPLAGAGAMEWNGAKEILTLGAVTEGRALAVDANNATLIQSGTGAGQLDITSGVVKANLAQILGTTITETAGQIAAAFTKFFNKASPTGTVNSLPDAVAGTTSGITIVGSKVDLVDVPNATAVTAIQSGLATLTKLLKYAQLLARKDAAIATDNATELTAINANGGSGAGAFANTTDSEEALRDRGDAAWITGGVGLSAQDVRDAMKLAPSVGVQPATSIDGKINALVPSAPIDLTVEETDVVVS